MDARLTHAVAVARHGSFTKAAEAVGVTQSAVTRSVADLEKQLGVQLFLRTSRGAILTERGQEFVDRAAVIIDDTQELLASTSQQSGAFSGVLRIGVCPASLEWLLRAPVAQMLERHPDVRLEVSATTFDRIVQMLHGGLDVAVGFVAAFNEWPNFKIEPLPALDTRLFVRVGHPLLKRSKLTSRDIAAYPMVSPSESRPYGSVIRDIYAAQGIDWRQKIHVIDQFPLAKRVVAATNAIGVVSSAYAQTSAFKTAYAVLDAVNIFEPAPMCCAFGARWRAKPAVRVLISLLRKQIAETMYDYRA